MRNFTTSIVATFLLAAACTAFGAGGGSMPSTSSMRAESPPQTPEEQARTFYNAGVNAVEKGDQLAADAARQADAKKQQKARAKSQDAYTTALKKFIRATGLNPGMYQAWNYVGYSNRKLGNYQAALDSYDRALTLKPGYPEAIEYRGHAYLALNRLADAKEAYLSLFGSNRKLAAQLLEAMQGWVGEHRGDAAGVDGASRDAFASWVNERSAIAGQTASLTREGASASW
jgi:tetratricopeptide (TPR) repeat protein